MIQIALTILTLVLAANGALATLLLWHEAWVTKTTVTMGGLGAASLHLLPFVALADAITVLA